MSACVFNRILAILLLFLSYNLYSRENDKRISLEKVRSINDENKDGYIGFPGPIPPFLHLDNEGILYMSDFGRNQILRFHQSKGALRPLGKAGSGPGEMFSPINLSIENDKLIFNDSQNFRIQIVDKDGNYISGFKMVQPPLTFVSFDNMIYGVDSWPQQYKRDSLMVIINQDGKVIDRFGKFLDFLGDMHPITSSAYIRVYKNYLYILFWHYPILRIYDLQGKFVSEHHFDNKEYINLGPDNYKMENIKSSNIRIKCRPLFKGFQIDNSGMYLGIHTNHIVIDHYDFDYKKIARFKHDFTHENFQMKDFILLPQTDDSIIPFVILEQPGPAELPYQLNLYEARINE